MAPLQATREDGRTGGNRRSTKFDLLAFADPGAQPGKESLMNTSTKGIRSFHPLPAPSDTAFANTPRATVDRREQVKTALCRLAAKAARRTGTVLHKVSFETVVDVLLWAVELYVVGFLVRLLLG